MNNKRFVGRYYVYPMPFVHRPKLTLPYLTLHIEIVLADTITPDPLSAFLTHLYVNSTIHPLLYSTLHPHSYRQSYSPLLSTPLSTLH